MGKISTHKINEIINVKKSLVFWGRGIYHLSGAPTCPCLLEALLVIVNVFIQQKGKLYGAT